jgi:glycosyltransferase involved in cell wall biosynthesis
MKILWVFNHPAPYKVNFFNELGKSCELEVLFERSSESDRNPSFYYQKAKNFQFRILKSVKFGSANNYTPAIARTIRKKKYDLIVMNGYSTLSEMKAIRYLHHHKIPYVFAINGGIAKPSESKLRKKIKTKYIRGAALYLAPDKRSADYLVYYGADSTKIVLYPYSTIFDGEILKAPISNNQQISLRKKEGLPVDSLYVSAGQFIPRKNNMELLTLWKRMPKDKTLLLVGSGPEKDEYERFIAENKLNNVLIKEYANHERILALFRMADFSIFLTREDIYGHVVNESLSQGTPVIATKNSNSAMKLLIEGKNGYLVDIDNEQSILQAFQQKPSELMRLEALATAHENTIEKMAQEHLKIFQEYLKK